MGQLIKTLYSVDIVDGESDVVKLPLSGIEQSIGVGLSEGEVFKMSPKDGGQPVGIAMLVCGANTGRIDSTIDSHETIDAGNAVWVAWTKGEITGTDQDTFIRKITAIRAVSVSGTITFKLSI